MIFYHRTRASALDSIMREGLKPCDPALRDPALNYQPAGIYLWRHYDFAVGNRREKEVVITVDIPADSVRDDLEFDVDDNDESNAVVCASRIPPSCFIAVHRHDSPEFRAQLAANRAELARLLRSGREYKTRRSG